MNFSTGNIRNTSFELMRLMLMFFIMWHHFIYVLDESLKIPVVKTADTFFHTAVLCFVILSGYFSIHFKIQRLIELIAQVIFFSFGLTCIAIFCFGRGEWKGLITSFMPFTNGYYWFIAIYLQLYILAPFINIILEKLNKRQYWYLIMVLSFLVFYVGMLRGGNVCNEGGKNIINFVLLYCIGDGIKRNETFIRNNIKMMRYVLIGILSFLLTIVLLITSSQNYSLLYIMKFIYTYNSPGLYIMAICIFMLFLTFKFHNNSLNIIAKSSLAIYLFHEHPLMKGLLYQDCISNIVGNMGGAILNMLLLSICLATAAICIDKVRNYLFELVINNVKIR